MCIRIATLVVVMAASGVVANERDDAERSAAEIIKLEGAIKRITIARAE